MKATPKMFEEITGRKYKYDPESFSVRDNRADTLAEMSNHNKSSTWIGKLGTMFNKLADFENENKEFRYILHYLYLIQNEPCQ